ncbi:MAG: mandelate racemase/muconate lactonizing enzyme family protein [Armatimonadetes bacterium]|nr:mandelate racemase/muconate lactonizing enzyme family protein [Armatimonadota bacterium]
MIIRDVTTAIVPMGFRNGVFTRIRTADGLCGVSEVVLKRRSHTVAQCIGELARHLVGQDARRIEDLWEKLYRDSFWVGGPLHATPLSAVEMALWDLKGKALGVPVYELLGGPTRDRIPVYCHCPSGGSPDAFADNVEQARQRGYPTIKTTLPLFYGSPDPDWLHMAAPSGYSGSPGALERTLKETERVPGWVWDGIAAFFEAARSRVGSAVDLAVDCHGRLNVASSKRLCQVLEPYHLLFIEEPLPPEQPQATREVKQASATPIASGERGATIYGCREWLEGECVSLWQPDVCNCGGFSQARKIAAMAEAHAIGIAPHNPNGPLATAQSVQFVASIPNFTILETVGMDDEADNFGAVTPAPLRTVDGHLPLPTAPGIGLEVHEEVWSMGHDAAPFEGWR